MAGTNRPRRTVKTNHSTLIDAMEGKSSNIAYTENGAISNKTTKSALLDFFGMAGAVRNLNEHEIIDLFKKAYYESPILAMKMLFYFRDIRGGQGERRVFRILINYLAHDIVMSNSIFMNFSQIPKMGRWDDFYSFFGTPLESIAMEYMREQLLEDVSIYNNRDKMEIPHISLLAKWLKSENTSSKESRRLASKFRKFLKWSPRTYRTTLSDLRAYLNVVERKMSSNRWGVIDYESVPSRAHFTYRKAFGRHDIEGYSAYLTSVKEGGKTIKATTLYPYDLVRKVLNNPKLDPTLDAQWRALPNYVSEESNALVIADTSGSMFTDDLLPISTSVALALYFAERNKGKFGGYFMTFSSTPKLIKIEGSTLQDKVQNISTANWAGSTNVQASFDLILETAMRENISQSEMPSRIFIISDMEFNSCVRGYTNFETIKNKYKNAGYEMPILIFWRVNSITTQHPIIFDEHGTMLVSGHSPSIFKNVMENKVCDPYNFMLEVLNQERYMDIVV